MNKHSKFETDYITQKLRLKNLTDISIIKNWGKTQSYPYVIAGPCSAETEAQVHETIADIAALNPTVSAIRAGIWKPRTRPNSFEGVGEMAVPWLVAAAKQVGLPTMVEIASPQHVEQALKGGVDMLWIGARTTVSPFNIQAIADSLRGIDVPVFIKNPVNPDLELWLGAFERLTNVGLTKLAAIHRGFSTYQPTQYRNPPMWEIPIELRRRYPNISILVDPSHIGGTSEWIQPLSQQALDMGFDGLMIETHRNPTEAWSDAKQQVTPQSLASILGGLVHRKPSINLSENEDLFEMRAKIDRIDDYIVELLGERMSISENIGVLKKQHDLAIHQSERWSKIVERAIEKGMSIGLTREFVIKLFQQVHNESIYHQTKVFEK